MQDNTRILTARETAPIGIFIAASERPIDSRQNVCKSKTRLVAAAVGDLRLKASCCNRHLLTSVPERTERCKMESENTAHGADDSRLRQVRIISCL